MAIAVVAAIHSYFKQHPRGVAPGQGFLEEFLTPFIERECNEARSDEVDRSGDGESRRSSRKKELEAKRAVLIRQCAELVEHNLKKEEPNGR